jgi:hypothetical protein
MHAILWSFLPIVLLDGAGIAQSVNDSLGAGRSGDRFPVGGEIFRNRLDRPWGPPNLLYNGYRSLSRG